MTTTRRNEGVTYGEETCSNRMTTRPSSLPPKKPRMNCVSSTGGPRHMLRRYLSSGPSVRVRTEKGSGTVLSGNASLVDVGVRLGVM